MRQLAGLLEVGLRGPLHVRHERLTARPDACRLMYVSDLHLRRGRSAMLAEQVVQAARVSEPDAVLLGGDLLDAASELGHLTALVRALRVFGPVLAVGGNHDRRVGLDRVCRAVEEGGGDWIHDTSFPLQIGARVVAVSGPACADAPPGDVRVLCAHHPRVWKRVRRDGYDLVLAGHLHGCQAVAFEWSDRLFPGALFYACCFKSHQSGPSRLVVSRGVSDLIPVRWRCPREVVVCHV